MLGNVAVPLPIFKLAVANTPVILAVWIGVAFTEFKSAVACNPDNVVLGENSKNALNGAPAKHDNPNIRILWRGQSPAFPYISTLLRYLLLLQAPSTQQLL
jgi:hypothetical protein